ncbi:MAG: alpha/beta fold hydrolase [Bacteroidetes bacterium]|jgi:phospholipase/carboxylesterase|nr:alpha/beta fold hydrolase [Bacteroidota bacterium]MBT6685944.1 alpha/beta fold hydrolase [Bacteroidota bacterium]MBT7144456.1 alpha/beta fold hydrolase [Bacteroidota bacterium]MBT7490825.1 alpha/beta fold hydrolase [Bacteroidota bacterium]
MKTVCNLKLWKNQLFVVFLIGIIIFGISCGQPQKSIIHHPFVYDVFPAKAKNEAKKPLLLLLHGFGSNERNFSKVFSDIDSNFTIVSMQAPIELSKGKFAWYELIFKDGVVHDYDKQQAAESLYALKNFVQDYIEKNNCNPDKVYILGFSQGAMMSLEFMILFPEIINGIVALSGKLGEDLSEKISTSEKYSHLSAFVGHGKNDKIVLIEDAREVHKSLKKLGIKTEYKEYDADHAITPNELVEIRNWLQQELKK